VTAGLTSVSLPDLLHLLRLIASGQASAPVGAAALQAAGLGHVWEQAPWLAGLDRAGLEALLRAVVEERTTRPVPRLDLVWTGPEASVSSARDTAVVVHELFAKATQTVIVGGYVFDGGADIFRPLFEAMRDRCVQASVFLHVEDEPGASPEAVARAAVENFFARNWPFGPPRPTVYYDPRTLAPHSRVSLHAKCVAVDDRWALVTSANFTDRGQTRNIEAGVLVEDRAFATALAAQWRGLIDTGLVRAHSAG